MNIELFNEWLYKAEQDFRSAESEVRRRRTESSPDVVCYLCQQCIEKYLKAYLVLNNYDPPHIHDLHRLKNLCMNYDSNFKLISNDLT